MSSANTDPAPAAITLEPESLIDKNNNICLQQEDTAKLLQYVWNGIQLPTTVEELESKIGVTEVIDGLKPTVNDVLKTYTVVKENSLNFNNITYPKVVGLADDVYAYASQAGSTVDDSFYANIVNWYLELCQELSKPVAQQDAKKISALQSEIAELVGTCVTSIEALKLRASEATQDLRDYETLTRTDQQSLTVTQGALESLLTGEDGAIEKLKAELDQNQKLLTQYQAEYQQGESPRIPLACI